MAFVVPKENYNGKINQIALSREGNTLHIGGNEVLSFLSFEGKVNSSWEAKEPT